MDIIAEKLKLDPLEFRLQNAFSTGDVSQTGQVLKAVGVKECLQKAASQIGWDKQKKGRNRGKGIACMHKWQGTLSSSALLKIDGDGTVILLVGTMEVGTGCDTILSQIVAEELGVPVENIKIAARDTDYIPYDTSTTASRSTFMMGNAVMIAANDAKEQLLNLASSLLKADRDNVVMQYGRIFVRSAPERILSLSEVALKALNSSAQGQVIGKGAYSFPPETFNSETGQGWESPWMYAAQAAEVEVDTETGLIKVHRIAAAHDVGKAINPSLCEGQIEGALATGLGAAVQEEILLKTGHILNPNFHDYKLCTTVDIPEISPILVEEALDEGPYGAKGLGEPALAPTAAAIANAVYYAVGVRIKTLPLTPERVLKALKEMRE
jgi:carbon-monoxide dehydrogenase large subunit